MDLFLHIFRLAAFMVVVSFSPVFEERLPAVTIALILPSWTEQPLICIAVEVSYAIACKQVVTARERKCLGWVGSLRPWTLLSASRRAITSPRSCLFPRNLAQKKSISHVTWFS